MRLQRKDLENKRVLVFGSGISGIGAVKLLEALKADVVLYDGNEKLLEQEIRKRLDTASACRIVLGELPQELIDSLDLVVMSPGVPLDIPPVERLKAAGIPIWGEVELAYQMGGGKVLAITGTNGKTTTTALLGEIMKEDRESRDSYDSVFVVGNIGNAYTGAALSMTENSCTVAEISSFQLETTEHFSPDVSGILNITEDHLNRHHTMEEYIRVKELIAAHQTKDSYCVLNYEDLELVSGILNITEDHLNRHHTMEEYIRVKELIAAHQTKDSYCVLNYEDLELREYAKHCPATPIFFSSVRKLEKGIFLDGDRILLRTGEKEIEMVRTGELKLLGGTETSGAA